MSKLVEALLIRYSVARVGRDSYSWPSSRVLSREVQGTSILSEHSNIIPPLTPILYLNSDNRMQRQY